jgi:ABC-type multidrug transport system ATPase subunit
VIAGGRLVGEGTPHELARRLGRRQRVVVRVDGPTSELIAAIAATVGVVGVTPRADALCIDGDGDVDLARLVGDAAHARGLRLRELREEPLALEDIFLQLVGDRPEEPRC